jgi:NRPS condensation-like uncharacterized protein
MPDYSPEKSFILIKIHHSFSDGLGLASLFLGLTDNYDPKYLTSMKPLPFLKKVLLFIISPYLVIATGSTALMAKEDRNILQNSAPISGQRSAGFNLGLSLERIKQYCHSRGCSINDFCSAVLCVVLHDYLKSNPIYDEKGRELPMEKYINVGLPFSIRQPQKNIRDFKLCNDFASVQSELILTDDFEKALAH